MGFSDRDLYECDDYDDRCGCGSDDICASIGGEPYCYECLDEHNREKERREARAAGKRSERLDVAGVLCLWRDEQGRPDYAEVDSSYICPALVEELELVVGAKCALQSAGPGRMRAVFAKDGSQ